MANERICSYNVYTILHSTFYYGGFVYNLFSFVYCYVIRLFSPRAGMCAPDMLESIALMCKLITMIAILLIIGGVAIYIL